MIKRRLNFINPQIILYKNFQIFLKKLFTFTILSLIIGSSKQEMATEPLTNKPKGGDYDNSNYPNHKTTINWFRKTN